ncbi:TPA: hypothetical protein NJZ01_004593, partial [Vibrio parahaemolyticus]|nr:hypothetical protein [Vibrio parahaemolyticus]
KSKKAIEMYRKSANNNNKLALERLALLSQLTGNKEILNDLALAPTEIERITVTAPDISEMLAYSLKSIDASGVYFRRKSCSRIANAECKEVKHVTERSAIAHLLTGRWH